jgi:hypothetical protein
MIWLVFSEAVIGEVEAPNKRKAEAAAREQFGKFGRVQSRIAARVAAKESVDAAKTFTRRSRKAVK